MHQSVANLLFVTGYGAIIVATSIGVWHLLESKADSAFVTMAIMGGICLIAGGVLLLKTDLLSFPGSAYLGILVTAVGIGSASGGLMTRHGMRRKC